MWVLLSSCDSLLSAATKDTCELCEYDAGSHDVVRYPEANQKVVISIAVSLKTKPNE